MLELKGYVTNLGKYNEGELIGEWIEFPITFEEFEEVATRIGIGEEYEEYFFTDWDCEIDLELGEYVSVDYVNKLAEKLEDWGNDGDLLKAACEIWSLSEVLENEPNDYYLYSDINNDYDLGYYWVEESGCYNLRDSGTLKNYIDYESFGRDIRFESNGGFTSFGWVELA